MISAPRVNPPRCPDDCGCRVCGDDLTGWIGQLATPPHTPWAAVDRQPHPGSRHHQPGRAAADPISQFDKDMDALHKRLAEGGGTP